MSSLPAQRPGAVEVSLHDKFPYIRREPYRPTEQPSVNLCDPIEQMAEADRADWALMRLVLCAATATLLLALAGSLPV